MFNTARSELFGLRSFKYAFSTLLFFILLDSFFSCELNLNHTDGGGMRLGIAAVIAYFIGSFPTAFLVSRIFFQRDIRKEGSGNVGTLNFLRVTRSRSLGVLVLLGDVGKGFLALWIARRYFQVDEFLLPTLLVILGHMFPIWLKGKGGRGLATLAGAFFFLQPGAVAVWVGFFLLIYLLFRKYILGVVVALFTVNLVIYFLYTPQLFVISSAASLLVILKYLPRLREELAIS